MVSYSMWNGVRVSGSRRLLTEILKNELGFEGFLVSDYYAIGQIDKDYRVAVAKAINAGMDMAMEPARYGTFIETLKGLVADGTVPIERIDDAVTRILRVKWAMGLMDPTALSWPDRRLHRSFGSAAHRKVARQAVRESLGALEERGPRAAHQLAREPYPHRGARRRRHRHSVWRMDREMAGRSRQRHARRHDDSCGDRAERLV